MRARATLFAQSVVLSRVAPCGAVACGALLLLVAGCGSSGASARGDAAPEASGGADARADVQDATRPVADAPRSRDAVTDVARQPEAAPGTDATAPEDANATHLEAGPPDGVAVIPEAGAGDARHDSPEDAHADAEVDARADSGVDARADAGVDAGSVCGDGVISGAEQCDGTNLGGATCQSIHGASATGTLACGSSCSFVASSCHWCGDGLIEGTKVCDGTDVGAATCSSVVGSSASGTLRCSADCSSFDLSSCSCTSGRKVCATPTPACIDTSNDNANCGACGTACSVGSVCAVGRCVTIVAKGLESARSVALDTTSVYWVTAGDGKAWSAPVGGGPAASLITSGAAGNPWQPVPVGASLFIATYNSGTIEKVAVTGGAATTVITVPGGSGTVTSMASDGTSLFWVDWSNSTVSRSTLTGANATTLLHGSPQVVSPNTIATDGTYLYWANGGTSLGTATVYRSGLDGSNPIALASGQNGGVYPLAVDGTNVYFGTNLDSAIYVVPATGAAAPTKYATTSTAPGGIALDATSVYWTDAAVMKMSKAGGAATTLVTYNANLSTAAPYAADFASIAVNGSRVFWSSSGTQWGNGAVFSAPKN